MSQSITVRFPKHNSDSSSLLDSTITGPDCDLFTTQAYLTHNQDEFLFPKDDYVYAASYLIIDGNTVAIKPRKLIALIDLKALSSQNSQISQSKLAESASPPGAQHVHISDETFFNSIDELKNREIEINLKSTPLFINCVMEKITEHSQAEGDDLKMLKKNATKQAAQWFNTLCKNK